jgi:hypothetical protein
MTITTQHAPGTFCWPELATTDAQGAKKFYSSLFGWSSVDNDMGPDGVYTMLKQKGADAGALHGLNQEQRSRGVPPHWNSYVAVESADQAAAKAKQLGGTVLLDPFDVMDLGRMAILQDPTGAMFSLWEAKKHIGVGILNEPGALCWTELLTTDTAKAEKFYTGLLPWKSEAMQMPQMTYTVFKRGDTSAGGMMKITPEMGKVPAHWLVYFEVADCDAAVAKAKGMEAKVTVPATDIPNIGRFAVLMDPQGAHFAVHTLKKPA